MIGASIIVSWFSYYICFGADNPKKLKSLVLG